MLKNNQKRHGVPPRGLMAMANPLNVQDHMAGKFGRMFPHLPPASFPEDALFALAEAMTTDDGPSDGPDPEESDFGAAYTYLGQFIDHDLTFDPASFAQEKKDPSGIVDFRTPAFDLDNLYGGGPDNQPFMYEGNKFALGTALTGASRNPNAHDLLRAPPQSDGVQRAIIGDPRNDENAIVSEFHGMMQRFHNHLVDSNPNMEFEEIARLVRLHYQWVVVHDFLPKIVGDEVLNAVSPAIIDTGKSFKQNPAQLHFYRFRAPVMPLEFSVAAYRLGHSMVRPGYRVHEGPKEFLLPIFNQNDPNLGLNAFNKFNPQWAIDWQRFIDLGMGPATETDEDRVQRAYRIDTSMVNPLSKLPPSVAGAEAATDPHKFSLGFRNMLRAQTLLLPSGQDVARRMGMKPSEILSSDQILIGAANGPDGTKPQPSETDDTKNLKADFDKVFEDRCPLWIYILGEARHRFYTKEAARLTGVGGRIVAETFLGLLTLDKTSLINTPDFKPMTGEKFVLADILKAALG